MKRNLLTGGITSLLILLFVFTATSKLYEYDSFRFLLCGSFIFTLLFTLYISYMLAFASYLPYSYGSVLKQLTWNQHLFFNVTVLVLALCGLWLNRKEPLWKNRITHALINPVNH